jgi:hypothetical protein
MTPTNAISDGLKQLRREQQGLQPEIDRFLDNEVFGIDGSLSRIQDEGYVFSPDQLTRDLIRNRLEEILRRNFVITTPGIFSNTHKLIISNDVRDRDSVFNNDSESTREHKIDEFVKTYAGDLRIRRGGRKTLRRKVKKSNRRRTIRR